MQAGLLKQRITVQKYVVTRDEYAAEVNTWEDYMTCRAYIPTRKGSRKTLNNESTQIGAIEVTIRKYKEVDETMRILWRGKKYKIAWIDYLMEDNSYMITAELINE